MKIKVSFVCQEVVGNMKDGIYEVPEGSTISDLFAVCEKENNIFINDEYRKWLLFLADGKPVKWDTVLHNVDTVHVIRAAVGG
ncbi:MAG: MoaD/ThiS family protein [Peptococcaceae bacterium]|nr:MoaD/ThiS family protein [Peptococcaceae bacterium]